MDFGDAEEIITDLEQDDFFYLVEKLRGESEDLITAIECLEVAMKKGNQLENHRKLKEIRGIGREIVHID